MFLAPNHYIIHQHIINIIYIYILYNINQHIKIISEGLCDTEDSSNGCWKLNFVITEINYIFKYIQM